MTDHHTPVLLTESLDWLQIEPDAWYLDATFGRGGHTQAILNQGGKVIALDYDQQAIEAGTTRFSEQLKNGSLKLIQANFSELTNVLADQPSISGILFDFGTSVEQLTDSSRGFSFQDDGPLDMRIDQNLGVTAADLLAVLDQKQLAKLFQEFGGEEQSKQIATAIVKTRSNQPITRTTQLVEIITKVKSNYHGNLHPATKVFQALRIAVNTELDNIEQALPAALQALAPTGRMVTIAFHEGEDRLAKHFLRQSEQAGLGKVLTKKPITPSPEELATNPRSRSAKLRAFEKN